MAVVQTGSLLSLSITSLVHLTRMGSFAGFFRQQYIVAGYCSLVGPS